MTIYTPVQCLVPTGYQMVYTFVPVPPPVYQMPLPLQQPTPQPVNALPMQQPMNMCPTQYLPPVSLPPAVTFTDVSASVESCGVSASMESGDPSDYESRSQSRSTSVETLDVSMENVPYTAPKIAVENVNNIALPILNEEMTKREIVNATLGWLSQVFQDRFDTIGNRGEFVLRVKIKTREALDHFCPFVQLCISENLLCRMSCPISTKNGRKHIRGYLAYMEALDGRTANRVLELFHLYNQQHNSVFAGEMVLNPQSIRPKRQ